MTRLRQPDPEKYSEKLRGVLQKMTPLEKADLYAYGAIPRGLSSSQARELLAAVPALYRETFEATVVEAEGAHHWLGDYEGSFGASVRDLKNVLLGVAAEAGTRFVTMPKVFAELRRYLEDAANHRWMSVPARGAGFHHLDGGPASITEAAWQRWLDLSDREVREALGLVDEARYLELFRKYVVHASHFKKKERLFDPVTGELQDPDERFMRGLESTMDPAAKDPADFRGDVLSRIGAWALSHPDEEPAYPEIFPDYFARLREDYYEQQKTTVGKSIQRMLEVLDKDERRAGETRLTAAEEANSRHALEVLLGNHDGGAERDRHTPETLRETLVHLAKQRY
jgi:hypothetical protein